MKALILAAILNIFFTTNTFACDEKEIAKIVSCNYGHPCFNPNNTDLCHPNIRSSYNESRVWSGIRDRLNEKCGFNISFKEEFELRSASTEKKSFEAIDSSGRTFSYQRCPTPKELVPKIIELAD